MGHDSSLQFGSFLFRFRSFLPVPVALALVLVSFRETESQWMLVVGPLLVVVGQAIRLWAVRHIGVISRTRAARNGPLITRGPYAWIRNPLYVGNWFLWTGFVVWSELLWMLPVAWVVYWLQYGAITRWEEASLRRTFGAAYEEYLEQVPPWIPWRTALRPAPADAPAAPHPWQHVHFSERGTLLAVGIMSLLLILKEAVR